MGNTLSKSKCEKYYSRMLLEYERINMLIEKCEDEKEKQNLILKRERIRGQIMACEFVLKRC